MASVWDDPAVQKYLADQITAQVKQPVGPVTATEIALKEAAFQKHLALIAAAHRGIASHPNHYHLGSNYMPTITSRADLADEFVRAVRQANSGVSIGPSIRLLGRRHYTLQEATQGISKYVHGVDIKSPDFQELFGVYGFDVDALNALPVIPSTTPAGNWFERNGVNPLYLICVALRLEISHKANESLKNLFPFDDVAVKVTNKKVFFTYYYNDDCVTIPDENVAEFPSPAFLAVLRVAMDGCKTII